MLGVGEASLGVDEMFPLLADVFQRLAEGNGKRVFLVAADADSAHIYASPDVRSSIEPCALRSLMRSMEGVDTTLPPSKRVYASPGLPVLKAEMPIGGHDSYLTLGGAALDAAPAITGRITAAQLRDAPAPPPRPDATAHWQSLLLVCMFPMVNVQVAD